MSTTDTRTDITDEEMRAIWTRNEVYQGLWDAVNGEPTPQQVKAATDCAADVARLHYELELAQLELAKTRAELDTHKAEVGHADTEREEAIRERDTLRMELSHPAVAAVAELVKDRNRQYRRAEAAHDAKDEANRRWLEAANPATTAEAAAREVTLAEAAQHAIDITLDAEQRRIAQAEREAERYRDEPEQVQS